MSALRYLMVICFMGFGCGSLQGMQAAGAPAAAPSLDELLQRPELQQLFAVVVTYLRQMPPIEELIQNAQVKELLRQIPQSVNDLLKKPEVKDLLQQAPHYVDVFKAMAFEIIDKKQGQGFAWLDKQRKEYSTGVLGKAFSYVDQVFGRKSFPISDDADLGEAFSLQEWAMACTQGDLRVIKHFLTNYEHLLNVSEGENKALSLAAFGFIAGEKFNGVVPTQEGFSLLVQDKRIDSKFLIRAGFGRIPFDEWLLHEASYAGDADKQARLETLKGLLRPTLSPERLLVIKEIRERKDRQRLDQEEKEAEQRKSRFNKISFVVGAVGTCAAIYYYVTRKAATPERAPLVLAAQAV